MGKPFKRTGPARRPSRAQGAFFDAFEENYPGNNDQLEKDVTTAWAEHPELAPAKAKRRNKKTGKPFGFSKSTYHSWRRQDTSPTIHDIEILCMVTGERQTLIVDPSASASTQDDDMEWQEEADSLIAQIGNLSPHQRSAFIGEVRGLLRAELAKAAKQNPQESDAAPGPRGVRRK